MKFLIFVPTAITPDPECTGCQFAAELASARLPQIPFGYKVALGSPKVPSSMFQGYILTSSFKVNGVCVTTSFVRALSSPFTVTNTDSVPDENFTTSAVIVFAKFLGLTQCQGSGNTVGGAVLSQVPLATKTIVTLASANSSRTTAPATPAQSNSNRTSNSTDLAATNYPNGPSKRTKITLGSSIPIVTILCCAAIFLAIKRYRGNKRQRQLEVKLPSSEEDQPYLQQKGELSAEEKHKFELEGHQRQTELDGSNEIHEMPDILEELMNRHRQELRGEEHCKELEHSR